MSEKLSKVPGRKKKHPVPPGRSGTAGAASSAAPDLSMIAESLRPLAVDLATLHFDPKNARSHDEENISAIKASLEQYGVLKPIVVQEGTNNVIAGNGQMQAALAKGWTHLPVVYAKLDDSNAAGFSIADNQSAALAGWDKAKLESLLKEVREGENAGIDKMLADLRAEVGLGVPDTDVDPDEVPEPPDDPITKPGDIWVLGRHRLMCGDSSKAADVDALLAGAEIHLVNTDPPYNVKVEPRSNNAIAAGNSSFSKTHHQGLDLARHPGKNKGTTKKMRPKDRPLDNDFVSDEDFEKMLLAWFGNASRVLQPGRGFYIWGGYANVANYPPALKAVEFYFSQAIIWVKEHPVLTRKDYMGNHEWCFYGWKEGAAHKFYGPANAPDVWSIKKVNPQSMVHLTEKPVALAARAIEYSSRAGENVLDLFGGSGSTLIACEQLGRHAFLMELDPAYCDVIVQRWETFTGKKAAK